MEITKEVEVDIDEDDVIQFLEECSADEINHIFSKIKRDDLVASENELVPKTLDEELKIEDFREQNNL